MCSFFSTNLLVDLIEIVVLCQYFLAIDVDPKTLKVPLHLSLAYKYNKNDSITLSSMMDRFEYVDASVWELRLYSRDDRIGNMVGKYQVS